MTNDPRINQLCQWLDSYLTIARAAQALSSTTDLVLHFLTSPPDFIFIHCSTANFRTLGIKEGEFYYNGPASNGSTPALYVMKSGVITPVLTYEEHFNATLISVNPEYQAGAPAKITAREVVVFDHLSKSGGQMTGPILMPLNWRPASTNELVPKSYVDAMRLELEQRIGRLESGV